MKSQAWRDREARARRYRVTAGLSLAAALLWFAPAAVGQGTPGPRSQPDRVVAVTFDDLPGIHHAGGGCSRSTLAPLNRKLIAALTRNAVPATGLVNEGKCRGDTETLAYLLRLWRDAGLELGNHSYSHFDLNATALDRYQADVIRGEATTRLVLREKGKQLKYFRHPFLHAGKDEPTRRALESFLSERGYRVAPVTIDNQEWMFAAVYARALQQRDRATLDRVGAAYIAYMAEMFDYFERLSVRVAGYEIKQVLLLHDNALNADYFDELVRMMKRRGYRFVSLDEALTDPAYRMQDRYAGPEGLSWLHRWSITQGHALEPEPREPAWIRRMFQAG